MDRILNYLKNPIVIGIVAFVVGTIFGWMALGWGLFPVEWTDAAPVDLVYSQKVEYLRMAMEAYSCRKDISKAQTRFQALGEEGDDALSEIVQNPGDLDKALIDEFSPLVVTIPTATGEAPTETQVVEGAQEPEEGKINPLLILIPIICVLGLVVVGVLVYFFLLKPKRRSGEPTAMEQELEARRQATWTDYGAAGEENPLAQFMASYKLGDDLFDDSFSIDSPSGEFLGECGVGISEIIGVGDPKKVTAFEVWLFDKNDIQTVTKVLMSSHAFRDASLRQRLETKGELVLAETGVDTLLETATLQMIARVVDMGYGEGAMPASSYFDRFVLELAVWSK